MVYDLLSASREVTRARVDSRMRTSVHISTAPDEGTPRPARSLRLGGQATVWPRNGWREGRRSVAHGAAEDGRGQVHEIIRG
jgi:hypothetical protein